jgi:SOS-response transcriptional repressor LexA
MPELVFDSIGDDARIRESVVQQVRNSARRVYNVLHELIVRGENPSERELAASAGIALSTANTHLKNLRAAGWVWWQKGRARSFKIVGGPLARRHIDADLPDVGVAAGRPTAVAEIDDVLDQLSFPLHEGSIFRIEARGDSMTGVLIFDGDTLVIRCQPQADHGDIVIATVPDEKAVGRRATVKRLDLSGDRPRLLAANAAYVPIESEDIRIVGKVLRSERHWG